jgi:outer membrane protein assembly factor BamD
MQRFLHRVLSALLLTALVLSATGRAHAGPIFAKKQSGKKPNTSNPLAGVDSKQPDKQLYDKAMLALKKGHYDVCRLDLQTLLNTYPDSEYQMRAKLAIGDTWYKEGGSAALTQAEAEYKDFITFFPNTPEAAEAQMKVGDIYFQQMEKPVPRAKQRLRDVQEVLAQRQYEIGTFYATHMNWAATIARLQTVSDTYPLFSHSDLTLIALGDAYVNQAQQASRLNIPPAAKAQLVKVFNDRAAAEWSRVVTRYPMAPHVEDAKDRLIALGRPVPEPTPQQLAESEAEEGSRVNVKVKDRALMLVKHGPSTIEAARVGDPTLTDPSPTLAPAVSKGTVAVFQAALKGEPLPGAAPATASDATSAAISNGTAPPRTEQPASPLKFETVPDSSGSSGSTVTVEIPSGGSASNADTSAAGAGAGNPNGPGNTATPAANSAAPTSDSASPASPETGTSADANRAVRVNETPVVNAVGPTNNQPLPPVDKPAEAPDQINDVKSGGAQVSTGTTATSKKGKKAPYDSKDESSSKHKKKKGLSKLNPF